MEQVIQLVLEAASVEEALEQASKRWGLPSEDLIAEVIGEGKKFLGLFGTKLKVKIEPKRSLLLKSQNFLSELMNLMELRVTSELSGDENNMILIEGQDSSILLGRHGDGLKALEYLLNLALRSPGDGARVRLDSGGYRERRKQSLIRLAEATARKVVEQGRPIRLEPMLSWERWVIHTTLKERSDVETQSVGESPDRKIVVMPKIGSAERQESVVVKNRSRQNRQRRFPRRP
ncbi:single-stranded DNA-binding protein [Synergistales bacterium]|nr:single-stranded DNA-binding protein [Synergistales bacterium]